MTNTTPQTAVERVEAEMDSAHNISLYINGGDKKKWPSQNDEVVPYTFALELAQQHDALASALKAFDTGTWVEAMAK